MGETSGLIATSTEELAVFVPMDGPEGLSEADILAAVHREFSRAAPGGYSLRDGYTERWVALNSGMTGRQYVADVAQRAGSSG